jgi:uncharacterized protein (TIGR02118 family)
LIKLVCLVSRPADTAPEAFRDWWLGHHVHVAAALPGLRRYVVSTADDFAQSQYDGVAELWFDSTAAMDAAFASPEGQQCAAEDRDCLGERIALVTTEHVVVP